jgi:biopolymer transport protein ExbB/TolQ
MSTTLEWYREGGPIMLLILATGIAGLAILLERGYVIVFRGKNNGRVFIERIIQLVRGGKIDDAIKQCAVSRAVLSDVGLLILRSRSRDEADLERIAETAALAILPRLARRLHYLSALAVSGVLLGILGGVLIARAALAAAGAPALSAALSRAFTPVAFGIAVAIVLVLVRAYLVSQADALSGDVREFSARLIAALTDRPDIRLGHR